MLAGGPGDRGGAIGVREAGIGPMDPPARLLCSALVGLASSGRSLAVRFRPAVSQVRAWLLFDTA
jgi:hypothetical protein